LGAVAELGGDEQATRKIAAANKENRRIWLGDLLRRLHVADPEGLATQLQLLVDGAIVATLVRKDPSAAHAALAC
jgi:hypothetical protein